MKPSIRFASLDDARTLSELATRSFRDAFGDDNTPEDMAQYLSTSFTLESTQHELRDPSKIFLLAETDQLLGYAMLSMATSEACVVGEPSMEIERIYVDAAAIGVGVGASLMDESIAQACKFNCVTLWLGVWEKNTRAINFYERWGFRRVGLRSFQLGSDEQTDLVMSLSV